MEYDTTKPYVSRILSLIQQTWSDNPFIEVRPGIYPVFCRKEDGSNYWDVDHTDGIGSKGIHHWNQRTFYNAVIDALAMNINDLIMARAIPFKTQCHLILPEDDHAAINEIMENFVEECQAKKIVITGGETSIHENIVGMEMSLTMTGTILGYPKRNHAIVGDVVVGFASNGIHSNGLTKARKVLGTVESPNFTVPTRIYAKDIKPLFEIANGLMHISGGSMTKLKQIIGPDMDIDIYQPQALRPHSVFYDLFESGVRDEEMYRTFNTGIGFIATMPPDEAEKIVVPGDIAVIGTVRRGNGLVSVKSAFTGRYLSY